MRKVRFPFFSLVGATQRKVLNRRRRMQLKIEQLELRQLMATDLGFSPGAPAFVGPASRGPEATIPLDQTFELSSRPSATKTIYLDFDGHTVSNTAWNGANNGQDFTITAYNVEGNDSFTDNELRNIQEIWIRVVEDFAPFDVNVTTKEPPLSDLINLGGSDDRWGVRALIGSTYAPYASAGGVAYIGSFNWDSDTPALVFEDNLGNGFPKYVAEATSHEVGHSLGLLHDGRTTPQEVYYGGHGSGMTGWAPIMGVGYDKELSQWSNGEYLNANNREQDDLLIITTENGFGYREDDFVETLVGATDLSGSGVVQIAVDQQGVIEKRTDKDVFRIAANDGPLSLTVRGAEFGPNIDIQAELLDSAGNVIEVSNPIDDITATIQRVVTAGTYYLRIDGVGVGDPEGAGTGYYDYASLGQYYITGTFESGIPPEVTPDAGTASYLENDPLTAVSPNLTVVDNARNSYPRARLSARIAAGGSTTDQLGVISQGAGSNQIQVTGNDIRFGGIVIGTILSSTQDLQIDLNADCTTAALQALMRKIGFRSLSDAPTSTIRRIEMGLGNAFKAVTVERTLQITALNDSPTLSNATFPIDEDAPRPSGQSVLSIAGAGFADPDPSSSMAGLVVVANPQNASQGVWYYSSDFGTTWSEIGSVNDSDLSLVINATDWIGFKPAADYYGTATPLQVRALDNTYQGGFSRSTVGTRVYLASASRAVNGPVAAAISQLRVNVVGINDAPRATVETYTLTGRQDEFFQRTLPSTLFVDSDSTNLQWTVKAFSSGLPSWLTFNPTTRVLSGTPLNADVGTLSLQVVATDDQNAEGQLILNIEIENVNDAPEGIQLLYPLVMENSTGGVVGELVVHDPDPSDSFTWTLSDPRFRVVGKQLMLAAGVAFDFEQVQAISFDATAFDSGTPSQSVTVPLTVQIVDENEFFPDLQSQTISVPFGTTSDVLLATLSAIDGDTLQNVTMALKSGDIESFELDSLTGELRFTAGVTADANVKSLYTFIVEAVDTGTPARTRAAQIQVEVLKQNAASPEVPTGQVLSIGENANANAMIGQVRGLDADGDGIAMYEITSQAMANLFFIEPTSGVLRLGKQGVLDFEAGISYEIPIRVTDDGLPARSGTGVVTVTVSDQNDPPTGISVGSLAIPTRRAGFALATPTVTDQDVGSYLFSTTDSRFEFRNGVLSLKPSQFFTAAEAGSSFQISVTVVDASDATSRAVLPLTLQIDSDQSPWQNKLNPMNVNRDNLISPQDAIQVLNYLNQNGTRALPALRAFDAVTSPDLDVNADGIASPIDALQILNYLNTNGATNVGGEGEGEGSVNNFSTVPTETSNDGWLGAFQGWEEEWQGRKRRNR